MKNKTRDLIVSRMQTPDGTILESKHVHDYVKHVDKNGYTYVLDGGNHYQHISAPPNAPMKDVSIYSDSPFSIVRKHYARGGRGKNGDQPLKWVPLCEMSDEWLKNCITYNWKKGHKLKSFATRMYIKELVYRFFTNQHIAD